jgi:hypothetical protein
MTDYTRDPLYLITCVVAESPAAKFLEKYKDRIIVKTTATAYPDLGENYILSFTNSKIELMFQLAFGQSPIGTPELLSIKGQELKRRVGAGN